MSPQPVAQCPWCGQTKDDKVYVFVSDGVIGAHVVCDSCDAQGPWKSTPELAIEAWNEGPNERARRY